MVCDDENIGSTDCNGNLWQVCNACGGPPKDGQNLKHCTNCHSVAYHNARCQRHDWRAHKRVCPTVGKILKPLRRAIQKALTTTIDYDYDLKQHTFQWWDHGVSDQKRHESDTRWQDSVRMWYHQEYLSAMKGFQQSMEPYQRAWQNYSKSGKETTGMLEMDTSETSASHHDRIISLQLARRFLFCGFCELDGEQLDSARDRLVQCLTILLTLRDCDDELELTRREVWDDAWMELTLSMEEATEHRGFAKNVAAMALSTTPKNKVAPCRWSDPLQRPGYMASNQSLNSQSFLSRSQHPEWCRVIEKHFDQILDEYHSLCRQSRGWSKVGSGNRGSGHEDHRVVSGQDWSEFVLFGTGALDSAAPVTQGLLRQHVPDAVSLAEQGGGEVIFSRLAAKTRIQAHCGPTNLRWTAHLGLIVPTCSEDVGQGQCRIRVAQEWHAWEPGRILLFDDSFEHEVHNDTTEERVVLLVRLWHPDLPVDLREQSLIEAKNQKESAIEKRYHPPN